MYKEGQTVYAVIGMASPADVGTIVEVVGNGDNGDDDGGDDEYAYDLGINISNNIDYVVDWALDDGTVVRESVHDFYVTDSSTDAQHLAQQSFDLVNNLTALEQFAVWTHQQLNSDRSKYLNVATEVTPFALENGCWSHTTASTPQNTFSMVHTTNGSIFEGGKGKYRLTTLAHEAYVDIKQIMIDRGKSIRRQSVKDFSKAIKLVYKEGTRKTVTAGQLVRNVRVRKAALDYHGHVCMCCERTPEQLGFDVSFLDTHHVDELKTYEEKGIRSTDVRTQIIVACAGCHRTHIHKKGHKLPQTLTQAKKSYAGALSE